jgi:hypothetical protein
MKRAAACGIFTLALRLRSGTAWGTPCEVTAMKIRLAWGVMAVPAVPGWLGVFCCSTSVYLATPGGSP